MHLFAPLFADIFVSTLHARQSSGLYTEKLRNSSFLRSMWREGFHHRTTASCRILSARLPCSERRSSCPDKDIHTPPWLSVSRAYISGSSSTAASSYIGWIPLFGDRSLETRRQGRCLSVHFSTQAFLAEGSYSFNEASFYAGRRG